MTDRAAIERILNETIRCHPESEFYEKISEEKRNAVDQLADLLEAEKAEFAKGFAEWCGLNGFVPSSQDDDNTVNWMEYNSLKEKFVLPEFTTDELITKYNHEMQK